jgi:hypothetical protein
MKIQSFASGAAMAAEATSSDDTASRVEFVGVDVPEKLALSPLVVEREVLQLYKDVSPGLLRYITALCRRPEIAQEIVQEAFLRYYVFRLRAQIRHGAVT